MQNSGGFVGGGKEAKVVNHREGPRRDRNAASAYVRHSTGKGIDQLIRVKQLFGKSPVAAFSL